MYCIASFDSRNDAFSFGNYLRQNGIFSRIIDAPREIVSSCSLALQFNLEDINKVMLLESRVKYPSFVGFFKITEIGNRRIVQKLY